MRGTFIEVSGFSAWRDTFLTDEAYTRLQYALMANPELGRVIPGCGGLRKLRIVDPTRGKGKRGGARVIYLHVPSVKQFYLLDIYGKGDQDDLSHAEKNVLRELAQTLKTEALEPHLGQQEENLE